MNNVITYQQMTEQPVGPNNPVEESGGCQGGAAVGLIFLLALLVAVIIVVVKAN